MHPQAAIPRNPPLETWAVPFFKAGTLKGLAIFLGMDTTPTRAAPVWGQTFELEQRSGIAAMAIFSTPSY